VSIRTMLALPTQMDLIVKISTMPRILRNPMMKMMEIDFGYVDTWNVTRHNCSVETTSLPNYIPEPVLHLMYPATTAYGNEDPTGLFTTSMIFGCLMSFLHFKVTVKAMAWSRGWNLVYTAYHSGFGNIQGGSQVSHLVQHPETLECFITFQATRSLKDWIANIDFWPVRNFCGLPGIFHRGFRNHLRNMIYSDDWQSNIKTKLPSCAKVYVAGASLGAATSDLFTACVNHAPTPENDPEGDYQYFGWQKGVPALLPAL